MIYDSKGNCISNKGTFLGKGAYGSVTVNNDICYKVFRYKYIKPFLPLIEEFMNLDLNYYYKILDILYDENKEFIGYTSKYYQDIEYDLLVLPKDYLINSFYGILNDIRILSKHKILVDDLHINNALTIPNKILLIDVDEYRYENINGFNSIYGRNKYYLFKLIYYLYARSLDRYHKELDYRKANLILEELMYKDLEKELHSSDNVIEYIKKLIK